MSLFNIPSVYLMLISVIPFFLSLSLLLSISPLSLNVRDATSPAWLNYRFIPKGDERINHEHLLPAVIIHRVESCEMGNLFFFFYLPVIVFFFLLRSRWCVCVWPIWPVDSSFGTRRFTWENAGFARFDPHLTVIPLIRGTEETWNFLMAYWEPVLRPNLI